MKFRKRTQTTRKWKNARGGKSLAHVEYSPTTDCLVLFRERRAVIMSSTIGARSPPTTNVQHALRKITHVLLREKHRLHFSQNKQLTAVTVVEIATFPRQSLSTFSLSLYLFFGKIANLSCVAIAFENNFDKEHTIRIVFQKLVIRYS